MKKTFTQFFLFAIFCVASVNLNAQTYLINDGGSYEVMNRWSTSSTKTFDIANPLPCETLSFNYSAGTWPTGGVDVTATYVDGSSEKVISAGNGGTQTYNFNRKVVKSLSFKGTGTVKKSISNIQLTAATYADAPAHSSWTAPTANAGAADEVTETTLAWSNVAPFNVSLTGEGASQFTCAISNNASVGNYGVVTISATYKHNVAGTHNAVLTITNGSAAYEIALTGTTLKKNQQINWSDDCLSGKLPAGKEIVAPATATSGLALTYTSSNESVIAIINDGTGFKALAAGEATITALQAGNNDWNEVSDSKDFVVTEKQIQYIHWTNNLTNLKLGVDTAVVLNATAQVLVDAENNETIDAPERTALITYQTADSSVVVISGDTLLVIGEGETTVTAILPGNDTYEATTITMPVRVRVPSAACESYVLNAPQEVSLEYSVVWQERIYEPAAFTGPAHILTFEARKERMEAVGNIQIQQYVNGAWQTIDDANPGTDWRSYYYELDRNATKIRFYNGYGSYTRYFKNVLVTQATYLETTTPVVNVEKSIIGDEIVQTVAIQYSNLPAGTTISHVSYKVTLSDNEILTDCGAYGEKLITLTAQPTQVGTILDTITVFEELTGLSLSIPVAIHTQRNTQTILWNDNIETLVATDAVAPLTATAVNEITYTTSDSAIAYVDSLNQLVIQAAGLVTITAHAAESDFYAAAQLSKTITILHAEQTIEWAYVGKTIEIGDSINLFTDITTAVASSGLEVAYEYSADWANYVTFDEITGAIVAVAEGIVYITAYQDGDHIYAPAEDVVAMLTIVAEGMATGMENTPMQNVVTKQIINGQLVIIRNGQTYDIQGRVIR